MHDLLIVLKDFLTSFLSSDIFIYLFTALVPSCFSFWIAKYSASRPEKIKVKQLQLSNVYLPLHRLFLNLQPDIPKKEAIALQHKLSNILDKHYELVFPQLHKLNSSLQNELLCEDTYQKTLIIMKHQIDMDYELLKKALGYPSDNFRNIFIRMTFKQKIEFIVSWLNVVLIFSPAIISSALLSHLPKQFPFLFPLVFLLIVLSLLVIIKLNKWVSSLKD